MRERHLPAITVFRSNSVVRADGRAGLVLDTAEHGSFVIEVDLAAVATIREHLADIETHLRRSSLDMKTEPNAANTLASDRDYRD